MNAFTRMFYEPNSKPPRLSMARMLAWPCALAGLGLIFRGAYWYSEPMVITGGALLGLGVVLYTLVEWRRVKAGPVEVERGDDARDS